MEARLSQTYGHKYWCVILRAEKHIWTLDKCQQEDNRYCYEMKNLVKVIVLGPWESLLAATILFRFMWLFLTLSTFFCSPFSSFIMLVAFTFPMSVRLSVRLLSAANNCLSTVIIVLFCQLIAWSKRHFLTWTLHTDLSFFCLAHVFLYRSFHLFVYMSCVTLIKCCHPQLCVIFIFYSKLHL